MRSSSFHGQSSQTLRQRMRGGLAVPPLPEASKVSNEPVGPRRRGPQAAGRGDLERPGLARGSAACCCCCQAGASATQGGGPGGGHNRLRLSDGRLPVPVTQEQGLLAPRSSSAAALCRESPSDLREDRDTWLM